MTDTTFFTPSNLPRITIEPTLGRRIVGDAAFERDLLAALRLAHDAGTYPAALSLDEAETLLADGRL